MAETDQAGRDATRATGRVLPPLALVGFVLFVVSWFVPVVPQQGRLDELRDFVREHGSAAVPADAGLFHGPDWLPGWAACRCAWDMLVAEVPRGGSNAWKQRVVGATCLTNLAMLGAIVAVLARRRRPTPATLGAVLLGCAALDASWLYLDSFQNVDSFAAGYWLWLASFALAGAGLLRRG